MPSLPQAVHRTRPHLHIFSTGRTRFFHVASSPPRNFKLLHQLKFLHRINTLPCLTTCKAIRSFLFCGMFNFLPAFNLVKLINRDLCTVTLRSSFRPQQIKSFLLESVLTLTLIRSILVEFMEPIKYCDWIIASLLAQYFLLSAITATFSSLL